MTMDKLANAVQAHHKHPGSLFSWRLAISTHTRNNRGCIDRRYSPFATRHLPYSPLPRKYAIAMGSIVNTHHLPLALCYTRHYHRSTLLPWGRIAQDEKKTDGVISQKNGSIPFARSLYFGTRGDLTPMSLTLP